MPAYGDLVHQTTASNGTGNLTLAAVSGKRTFASALGTGGTNTFDYYISHRTAAEWERGTGHETGGALVRDTVVASSNANAAVNFTAGVKDVTNDQPADRRADKSYVDAKIVVSDTPPPTPTDGMLWWKSDTGTLYIRYNDGSSTQWVEATAVPSLDAAVLKSGDTMTGPLTLSGDPTLPLHAATKQWAAPFDALGYSGMQVNGSMEVNQEQPNTSITASGGWLCDEWVLYGAGSMAVVCGQSMAAPIAGGINGVLYLVVGTAQPSLGAGDYIVINHPIEGYRVSRLMWGSPYAQPITIAFWSMHQRTGTYSVSVGNNAGTRGMVKTYTQLVSNIVQYNVITFPGCTDGVWEVTTGCGLWLSFTVAAGSNNTAPSAGVWHNQNYLAAPGQVNGVGSTADQYRITGVTVLPGSHAPTAEQSPFIMRPFDQEITTCQRYLCKSYAYTMKPGTAVGGGGNSVYLGGAQTGSYLSGYIAYPVHMRATPTLSIFNNSGGYGTASFYNAGWYDGAGVSLTGGTTNGTGAFVGTSAVISLVNFDYVAISRMV